MKFKITAMKSLKLYFEQQTIIFLSGTTIKQILPSFNIIIIPYLKFYDKLYYIIIFPSKLHTGTSIHYTCVVSLHITHKHNQLHDRLEYEPIDQEGVIVQIDGGSPSLWGLYNVISMSN